MNAPGIPSLYLAFSERTAVSEGRPWKGALVSVGRFSLSNDVRVVDLTSVPGIESPFVHGNEILHVVEQRELLDHLASELSAPVNPEPRGFEYVATQYFTELIKSLGFEGIKYPSALGPEPNLVLFDTAPTAIDVWLVEVTDVVYTFEKPHRRTPW